MKVLLAVDGSEYSRRAANFVANNLTALAVPPEIHCLHVHAELPVPGARSKIPKSVIEKYQREESEAALAVALKELQAAKLPVKASWVVGDIVEEVARYVAANKIDLIVVGSHGRGRLAALALGSVAMKILATVKTPALIIR
jgi:nucleotide-binding universal stress UspA family protein